MGRTNTGIDRTTDCYRILFHKTSDVVCVTDSDFNILMTNPAASTLLGYGLRQLRSLRMPDLLTRPADWERVRPNRNGARRRKPYRVAMLPRQGDPLTCLLKVHPLHLNGGCREEYCFVLRDISAYLEALASARDKETRYLMLAENVTDGIWTTDLDFRITYITPSIRPIIGYSPEETMGMTLDQLIVPSSLPGAIAIVKKQMAIENRKRKTLSRTWTIEIEMYHKDGFTVWAEVKTTFLRDEQGKPIGLLGVTHNITERKRSQDALRNFSTRLVAVQEQERYRIARELHDEIGQSLTGLRLSLELMQDLPSTRFQGRLSEAQALINDLMTRVRDLSLELRPPMLDDLGLLPTLLRHLERYEAQTHIRVDLKQKGIHRRFSPDLETAAFRIVQESLTNIARHSQALEAYVQIIASSRLMRISIQDNGIGFDPQMMLARANSSGLAGMQERVSLLGGHLKIESSPGKGTLITASFPVGRRKYRRSKRLA